MNGMSIQPVDVASFKRAMSQLAAAVTIVTTGTADDPRGTTVSAFMSLSADPPMVLISLHEASSLLAKIDVGAPIGVNVLSTSQDTLARRFADKSLDRFAGVDWAMANGVPKLANNHTWVAGRVNSIIAGGDHRLVLVDVEHAEVNTNSPLLYWQREFGTHGAIQPGDVHTQSVKSQDF